MVKRSNARRVVNKARTVNPRRAKANPRRRVYNRKPVSVLPALYNPRRRHRTYRRRNPGTLLSGRRNPIIRHHRRRRNPPELKSLVKNAGIAAVGAGLTQIVVGIIPAQFQYTGWTGVLMKVGVAYAIAWGAEKFVSPATAQMLGIGGAAAAASDAIKMLLGGSLPSLSFGSSPAPPVQVVAPPQMSDIVVDPFGMSDIVQYPF